MSRNLLYLAVLLVLASCKPTVPSRYIQPDEMEDILYDFHLSQSMGQFEDASMKERDYHRLLYFAAVLEKHGVTKAEFDSSMVYYFTRAEYLEKIYKNVSRRLEQTAVGLGATDGEISRDGILVENGDTTNIWKKNSTSMLMTYPPNNRLEFTIKGDSSFHKGDQFVFSFKSNFLYQSGSREAVACLTMKLDNDSVVSRVSHITVSGFSQLRMDGGSNHVVKEINGYVYLGSGNEKSTTLKLMFITNLQLIRFHQKEIKPQEGQPADSLVRVDSVTKKDTIIHFDSVRHKPTFERIK